MNDTGFVIPISIPCRPSVYLFKHISTCLRLSHLIHKSQVHNFGIKIHFQHLKLYFRIPRSLMCHFGEIMIFIENWGNRIFAKYLQNPKNLFIRFVAIMPQICLRRQFSKQKLSRKIKIIRLAGDSQKTKLLCQVVFFQNCLI